LLSAHRFADPLVNLSLELFLRELQAELGERLISVVLFGSIVFDDLAPGYGDLDFMAILKDEPDEAGRRRLIDLRKPLRNGDYGIICNMIEGPFLPLCMLDPAKSGQTICWGTGGERSWDRNKLGWFVHRLIQERGIVIYGADIRPYLPMPTHAQLLEEARTGLDTLRKHGRGGNLHSADWLLMAARSLLWLEEDRLVSKSEAAEWAFVHADGLWRKQLPTAKEIRLNPSLAESDEVKRWLISLDQPISEACDELTTAFQATEKLAR